MQRIYSAQRNREAVSTMVYEDVGSQHVEARVRNSNEREGSERVKDVPAPERGEQNFGTSCQTR